MLISVFTLLSIIGISNAATLRRQEQQLKIVVGNDDGWATANIRALYKALNQAGYMSLISAPAINLSGTGSFESPPVPLLTAGEFDSIPAGSPATGSDPTDPKVFYVNSFPATAIEYGIEKFAPQVFEGKPDFVVTGVNIGNNLGLKTLVSGTVGAASHAVKLGVPAIAFNGAGSSIHSYIESDLVSDVYAQVSLKLVNEVINSGAPYLPDGISLNVNLPMSNSTTCTKASDYSFVLTRVNTDINPFNEDVNQCGSDHLPTETDVFNSGGCRVPVSVFDAETKLDVDKDKQKQVRDKIKSLLTCMHSP